MCAGDRSCDQSPDFIELDPDAVGVGDEHQVNSRIGPGARKQGPAALHQPGDGGVDVVDIERQVGDADLSTTGRGLAEGRGAAVVEQLDAHVAVADEL